MAAPHVAGVAALWLEKLRKEGAGVLSRRDLWGVLTGQATRLAEAERTDIGSGLVRAPLD